MKLFGKPLPPASHVLQQLGRALIFALQVNLGRITREYIQITNLPRPLAAAGQLLQHGGTQAVRIREYLEDGFKPPGVGAKVVNFVWAGLTVDLVDKLAQLPRWFKESFAVNLLPRIKDDAARLRFHRLYSQPQSALGVRSDDLDAPIFRTSGFRCIVRDRVRFPVTLCAEPALVHAVIRQPFHYRMGAFPRQL